jgi:exopolysaccharide biosynthesis polyprenyl glycosylphosphotransferase
MSDAVNGSGRLYAGNLVFRAPRRRGSARKRRVGAAMPEAVGSAEHLRRDSHLRRMLAAADVIAAALALAAGVMVFGDNTSLGPAALALVPGAIVLNKVAGLYDRDPQRLHKSTLDEAPAVFQIATLEALLIYLGQRFFVDGTLHQTQILAVWGVLVCAALCLRAVARWIAQAAASPERCLVVGDDASAVRVGRTVASGIATNAEVVGRVPLGVNDAREAGTGVPVLGKIDALGSVVSEHDIHRVVIAPGRADSEEILDLIRTVKALGVKVSVLPRLLEVVGSSVEFDEVNGVLLLGVKPYGLPSSSRVLKRAFDICGSLLLLALAAPLMAWIALMIRLESAGPVIFRQTRIGRDGKPFVMVKFRTMVDCAEALKEQLRHANEADGLFKIADDPRITRVGRLLRCSSLDELPQLVNVLRGDMSLVGPRPLVPDEDRRVEGWQRRRLNAAPGMTGQWQVLGSSRVPMHEMLKIDYLYGAHWSLWRDVKILLRTVPHALARRGQ